MITSKHWDEGWIVRPSHPLPLLSKVSQSNMSIQQYYLFDTYYDSLIRAPIDISKNNIEPKGKGARSESK